VVVGRERGTETLGANPGVPVRLVPDPRSALPGRGAWVHPDLVCIELAARRRAFPRALRVAGPVDDTAVRAHLAGCQQHQHDQHEQHEHDQQSPDVEIGSGSASDGYPMSSQR
jgi:predicted RNA-binding protein YlxR (DUF448 family)